MTKTADSIFYKIFFGFIIEVLQRLSDIRAESNGKKNCFCDVGVLKLNVKLTDTKCC